MKKVAYYPGCSLEVTAKAYNLSTRRVSDRLEVDLAEVPDWLCCGSSAGLKSNRLLSVSLAAKNIVQAEKLNLPELVVPCPFCYRRLLSAQQELRENRTVKDRAQSAIEANLQGDLTVQNLLGFFRNEIGLDAIAAKTQKPLKGLKAIPYYGCYTLKPAQITRCDDPENPTSMDDILRSLGAEVLDWDFKSECCGASLALSKTEKALELSGRLLNEALWRGAEAIVVACQFCQSNLDMRQAEIFKRAGQKRHLPILYFTQLMGVAFGLSPRELGLRNHLIDPLPLLKEKGFTA